MIETLEQRKTLAAELLRIKPASMAARELDLAMALLLHKTIHLEPDSIGPIQVLKDGKLVPFSPTSDWNDYGEVVSNVQLVTGSHERYDDESEPEKVTGHWYSCHGYFGGIKDEGYDLREVVGRTCARLLEHRVSYGHDWNNDLITRLFSDG
jgi:hypothetical protein